MRYKYELYGTAAGTQTWKTEGTIETEGAGAFIDAPYRAIEQSFVKLTRGEAIFGYPGVGCSGPYIITRMMIEREPN
jgi:hypothetical protein